MTRKVGFFLTLQLFNVDAPELCREMEAGLLVIAASYNFLLLALGCPHPEIKENLKLTVPEILWVLAG